MCEDGWCSSTRRGTWRVSFDPGELLFADLNPGLVSLGIESGLHRQSGLCRRVGDEVHDHLVTGQRSAPPVLGDEAEEAMLDLVPLARSGWEVTDTKDQARVVRQALQRHLPQTIATAVAPSAVGCDHQLGRPGIPRAPHLTPPTTDTGCSELRRVVIDPHT